MVFTKRKIKKCLAKFLEAHRCAHWIIWGECKGDWERSCLGQEHFIDKAIGALEFARDAGVITQKEMEDLEDKFKIHVGAGFNTPL